MMVGLISRWAKAAVLAFGFMSLSGCITMQARSDRQWYPYLAHTSQVSFRSTLATSTDAKATASLPAAFTVSPVSDWTYDEKGPVQQNYSEQTYKFEDLRQVWFVLEPQPDMTIAAHTFLLFEFSDDRLLGITIEARREVGEKYSAFSGAFNKFELLYLWGEARDLLTRRAVMLRHETFVYPLTLTDQTKVHLLRTLLDRTDALERKPRFYNTLFSNCTNELAKAAKLPWHRSFVLTGKSDQHLYSMKVIPGESFATARASADMTKFVDALNDAPDNAAFNAALLAELRKRIAR